MPEEQCLTRKRYGPLSRSNGFDRQVAKHATLSGCVRAAVPCRRHGHTPSRRRLGAFTRVPANSHPGHGDRLTEPRTTRPEMARASVPFTPGASCNATGAPLDRTECGGGTTDLPADRPAGRCARKNVRLDQDEDNDRERTRRRRWTR